ncbi:MAG: type II toxin-antitoxin system VapC family toxin [Oscillospiraceae bacterium]|jgi:tRNA(fMet)-specific endonuclease VapC|nr:type II toxin-antitoxin system VapC family toxin [Oscillospiraceae bacterium]
MIFLDTNIISYFFNSNEQIKEKLLEALDNNESVCTTVINVYEILKGLKWKNNHKKESQFIEFLNDILIFSIDENVVNIASGIYSDLRKSGKTIGDADILIAAIVIENNGTLITNNIKHYKNIDNLKLTNWL